MEPMIDGASLQQQPCELTPQARMRPRSHASNENSHNVSNGKMRLSESLTTLPNTDRSWGG